MKKLSIIVLIISLFLISCSKEVKTDLSPGEHLIKASENMNVGNAIDISAEVKLNMDQEKFMKQFPEEDIPEDIFTLVNDFTFDLDYKVKADQENLTFDYVMDYGVDYKDSTLLQFLMVMNEKTFGFGITNFYDKVFAVDFAELMNSLASMEGMENLGDLELKKYIEVLMTENEHTSALKENEVYKNILIEYLNKALSEGVSEEITYMRKGESITENVMTYTFKYDVVEIIDVFIKLMNEAETDETLKACIQTTVVDLLDVFITSKDYEVVGITLIEAEAMKDAFTNDFQMNWEMFFDEMKAEFTDFDTLLDDETLLEMNRIYDSMEAKISINKDEVISYMSVSMDYEGLAYDMSYVVNGLGEDVIIEDYSEQTINILDYIDFNNPEELQNKEELAKVIKEFLVSSITELIEGEGFIALYDDLKPLEDTLGFKVSDISTYLGMGKLYIENMTEEEIIEYLDGATSMYGYDDYDDYDYDDYDYVERILPELDYVSLVVETDTENSFAADETWFALEQNYYGITAEKVVVTAETALSDIQSLIDEGADMVFVIGDTLMPAIDELAAYHPDVQFIPLEGFPEYYGENMTYIDYYNEEVAYLAGYVASMMTETGYIGFVGGLNEAYYQNFGVSYRDGALAANPEIQVELIYTNDLNNPTIGMEAVNELSALGVDFIYTATGNTGKGVVDACEEKSIKVINHNDQYGLMNDNFVSTTMVDYYYIASDMIMYYSEGYISDYYAYGAADYMYLEYGNISEEIYNGVIELVNQITTGDLFIPTYYGE